jgi:hypothetical protein
MPRAKRACGSARVDSRRRGLGSFWPRQYEVKTCQHPDEPVLGVEARCRRSARQNVQARSPSRVRSRRHSRIRRKRSAGCAGGPGIAGADFATTPLSIPRGAAAGPTVHAMQPVPASRNTPDGRAEALRGYSGLPCIPQETLQMSYLIALGVLQTSPILPLYFRHFICYIC